MLDNKLAFIHSNKTAKYNYKYLDKDGTVYIGQKDGRLKKQEVTMSDIQSAITSSRVPNKSASISGTISTKTDVNLNPLLLMGG